MPQSHPCHRNVDIDRIGILHQVLSQHDKSHHAEFTQLKSDGSNLVRKRAEKGAETVPKPILAHINILALHRQSGIISYWAISEHLFIANILVLLVIGLYQFQALCTPEHVGTHTPYVQCMCAMCDVRTMRCTMRVSARVCVRAGVHRRDCNLT